MLSLAMALAAAGLPDETQCTALASEPAAALAYATGLQGFIYGLVAGAFRAIPCGDAALSAPR